MNVKVTTQDYQGKQQHYTMPDDELAMFVAAQDGQIYEKLRIQKIGSEPEYLRFNGMGFAPYTPKQEMI